jgi:hypothetical protein
LDMRQSAGVQSLIKTNSVSVTFGGPNKEPETPAGQDPARLLSPKMLFSNAPICVEKIDEDGDNTRLVKTTG